MLNDLIEKELGNKYKDCNFRIIEDENYFKVLYDNIHFLGDDKFSDEVFAVCSEYLGVNKLDKLAIVYSEIDNCNPLNTPQLDFAKFQ